MFSATSRNDLLTSKITLSPVCLSNYIFNPSDFKCYFSCPMDSNPQIYKCLEFDQQVCIKCQIVKDGSINLDQFSNQIYPSFKGLEMQINTETIKFDTSTSIITLKFNYDAVFFNYLIKLSTLYYDGSKGSLVPYSSYKINGNILQIEGVQISNPNPMNSLQIDLTKLQVTNLQGNLLINPVVQVSLGQISKQDSTFFNIGETSCDKIATFINENQ